jgi:hypothetical protein
MTETSTVSPDRPASGSTPNESSAATLKLDTQRELDRRQEPSTTSGSRRGRKLRVATTIAALLIVLGVGWGAGLKTHEFVDVAQVSGWFQHSVRALLSNLDTQRKKTIVQIEALASASPSQAMSSPVSNETKNAEVVERAANGLGIKLDLLRASSATLISELGNGFERLNGSVERSQRDLVAKLDQIQQRLERLENQFSSASSTGHAQPLETPAATKNAPLPIQPAAPAITAGTPKLRTEPAPMKRIESWEVVEVLDGAATLAGPRGIIEVSSGDVVPGLGRVESISRRGGRWVVATSRGVITGR